MLKWFNGNVPATRVKTVPLAGGWRSMGEQSQQKMLK
jgi:hypothetical protein